MVYCTRKGDFPMSSGSADLQHESSRTRKKQTLVLTDRAAEMSPISRFCPQSCHQSVPNRVTNCGEALMHIANHFIGKIRVA